MSFTAFSSAWHSLPLKSCNTAQVLYAGMLYLKYDVFLEHNLNPMRSLNTGAFSSPLKSVVPLGIQYRSSLLICRCVLSKIGRLQGERSENSKVSRSNIQVGVEFRCFRFVAVDRPDVQGLAHSGALCGMETASLLCTIQTPSIDSLYQCSTTYR